MTLEFFSGPMDLLLHLVALQEVPIEKVEMALVAEQYLNIVLSCTDNLDIDIASEYLVIAATLLAIKSRSLLPPESRELPVETEEAWEESRFFDDLRARLQAYELTKARALTLIETPQLGVDTYNRIDRKALLPTPEMLAEPEDVFTLGMLFGKLLKRIGATVGSYRVWLEPVSVVSYMMKILDCFNPPEQSANNNPSKQNFPSDGKSVGFRALLRTFMPRDHAPGLARRHRGLVIGSFIATLELVKRGIVSVTTGEQSDDFELTYNLAAAGETGELSSEFDTIVPVETQMGAPATEMPEVNDKVVQMSEYRAANALAASVTDDDVDAAHTGGRAHTMVRVGNFERGS